VIELSVHLAIALSLADGIEDEDIPELDEDDEEHPLDVADTVKELNFDHDHDEPRASEMEVDEWLEDGFISVDRALDFDDIFDEEPPLDAIGGLFDEGDEEFIEEDDDEWYERLLWEEQD
jgi:hypothetical protein